MPKIPTANRVVQEDVAQVPNLPNLGTVRAAFGENVFQANQDIAKGVGDIAQVATKHAESQKKLQNESYIADAESKYRLALQDKLFNPNPETVNVNGQEVTRISGTMNRQGLATKDSTVELDDWHRKTASSFIDSVKDPQYRMELSKRINNQYLVVRDNNISHEAKQMREGYTNNLEGARDLIISDTFNSSDINALNNSIDRVGSLQTEINKAKSLDLNSSKVVSEKAVKKTVLSAVMGSLRSDNSGVSATALLEGVSKKLNDQDYAEISDKIASTSKTLIGHNKAQAQAAQDTNGAKLVQDFVDGKSGVYDEDNIKLAYQSGQISEELGRAVIKAIHKPISPYDYDEEGNDQSFIDLATWAMESKNPKDRNDLIVNVMKGFNKDKLSQRNMTLLLQTALKFGASTDAGQQRNVLGGFRSVINASYSAGFSDSESSKAYLNLVNQGKSPDEAAAVVLKSYGVNSEKIQEKQPNKFGISTANQPPKGNGFSELLNGVDNLNKGAASAVFSSPQILGSFIKQYGEAPEQNRNFWQDVVTLPLTFGTKLTESLPFMKKMKEQSKLDSVKVGDKLIQENMSWISQQRLVRPEAKGLDQAMFDFGSGVGSLGLGVGVLVVSKNPVAAAAMFGAMGESSYYTEARRAGLKPEQASERAIAGGAVDAGIMMVGLKFMLQNYGGRLINSAVRSSIFGLQSGAQSAVDDTTAYWRNKDLNQVLQDSSRSATIGLILGFGTSAILDMAVKDGTIKAIKKQTGLNDEQASQVVIDSVEGVKKELDPVMQEIEAEVSRFDSEGGANPEVIKQKEQALSEQQNLQDEKAIATAQSEGMVGNNEGKGVNAKSSGPQGEVSLVNRPVGGMKDIVDSKGNKVGEVGWDNAEDPSIGADFHIDVNKSSQGNLVGAKAVQKAFDSGLDSINGQLKSNESKGFWKAIGAKVSNGKVYLSRDSFDKYMQSKQVSKSSSKIDSKPQIPVGTGDSKVSALADRIANSLDNIPESERIKVPDYKEMNNKQQIKAASEFVSEHLDDAIKVLKGEKNPPEGLLKNSILVALEEHAKDLTPSEISSIVDIRSKESSRFGQEIEILKEISQNSPFKYIEELHRQRVEDLGGRKELSSLKVEEIKKVKESIEKSKPSREDWIGFINSIKC